MNAQNSLPLVSCLTATHGRYEELCRVVLDFLRQDYPHKELLILNNHPQPLTVPEGIGPQYLTGRAQVRIFNEPQYATLGDCRKRLLELAEGEYVRTWDDDDVYLPWTLSQGVAHIGDAPAFKPQFSWFNPEGGGFRLEDNVFEAAMLVRRDFAREHPYQSTAGDEHAPLVEKLHNTPGAMIRRDLGVWASYVYRWGWGIHHISGTMGSGTVEQRTHEWLANNNDGGEKRDGVIDLVAAEMQRKVQLADMAPYAGEYRHEFYSRCFRENPPESQVLMAPEEVHRRIISENFQIPDGARICAMEFGRDCYGSTAHLLSDRRIGLLISVDPRITMLEPARVKFDFDVEKGRLLLLAELGDCDGCNKLPHPPIYLTLDTGCPMENLNALLQIRKQLAPGAVISCKADDACLVRTVLEPTHWTRRMGDYLVFGGREIPRWLHWQNLDLKRRMNLSADEILSVGGETPPHTSEHRLQQFRELSQQQRGGVQ